SAPMTPMPPVIKTLMLSSIDFHAKRVDQGAPVLEVALHQLGEILRRKIDSFEAVGLEELPGFLKVQCLGNVGMDFCEDFRWQLRRSPQPEPDRGLESGNRLANGRQVRECWRSLSVAAAISRTFPVLACSSTLDRLSSMTETSLPKRPVKAGAAP